MYAAAAEGSEPRAHKPTLFTLTACVSQDYIVDLFRGLIDRQEWTDSGSVSERVLRSYLLLFGCVRNYPPCVSKATHLFNKWRDSDGNMRSEVASHRQSPVDADIGLPHSACWQSGHL